MNLAMYNAIGVTRLGIIITSQSEAYVEDSTTVSGTLFRAFEDCTSQRGLITREVTSGSTPTKKREKTYALWSVALAGTATWKPIYD